MHVWHTGEVKLRIDLHLLIVLRIGHFRLRGNLVVCRHCAVATWCAGNKANDSHRLKQEMETKIEMKVRATASCPLNKRLVETKLSPACVRRFHRRWMGEASSIYNAVRNRPGSAIGNANLPMAKVHLHVIERGPICKILRGPRESMDGSSLSAGYSWLVLGGKSGGFAWVWGQSCLRAVERASEWLRLRPPAPDHCGGRV